jgi:tetratricopeptide (TPR) repeat protein
MMTRAISKTIVLLVTLAAFSVRTSLADLATDPRAQEIEKLWDSKEKKKAESLLDEWMKKEKDAAGPWVMSAKLRLKEGRAKKSLSLCDTALKKSPQEAEAYFIKGKAYESLGKPLEAANEYRAALIARADYAEAKQALDKILAQLGTPSEDTPAALGSTH